MGKGFLKFDGNLTKLYGIVLIGGFVLSIGLGISAYQETKLNSGNELPRNEAGEGAYEQELVAVISNERIPLEVTVEEKHFTESEANAELEKAGRLLDDALKGTNNNLTAILNSVCLQHL